MKKGKNIPPEFAKRLLLRFLRDDLAEEVQGDLDEKFYSIVKHKSLFRAKLNYWYQVINYLRPFALKKIMSATSIYPTIMFRHTLLISYRNFLRYKSSFFINLIGLSSGLASVLLIYLWVYDELSMDKFHENGEQLYQVMRNLTDAPDQVKTFDGNSDLLAPALTAGIPEVEFAVPVTRSFPDGILSVTGKSIKASGKFAGKNFFKIFSYPLIEGERNTLFADKYSIVISDAIAIRLFGRVYDVVNKTITWDQKPYDGNYTVSGVFKTSGYNSSEKFDFLLNNEVYLEHANPYWDSNNVQTYLSLRKDTNIEQFNSKIENFVKDKFKALYGNENLHFIATLFVRPYSDKYLYNRYENGVLSGGRIDYVILFSAIAVFILLIACVNFMNLCTARASRRLKEVGIKKAIGAFRGTLIFQYLGESMFLSLVSLLTAVLFVALLLPQFNLITGKQLALGFNLKLILGGLLIALITGFISGSYPALYLSGFKTAEVLKGKLNTTFGEVWIRRGLVVFQFTISILLMVGVVVVYLQMDYVQSKNLGYVKENVITFRSDEKINRNIESFLWEAKRIAGVENASSMGNSLGFPGGTGRVDWEGKKDRIEFNVLEVGYDLPELLEIAMKEGRSFSREFSADTSKLILNEMAVASMGLTDPVGKTIKLWDQDYQIIGITKDFYFESLYENVKPCILRLIPAGRNILIKIQAGTEREAIGRLEKLYRSYTPEVPFDFRFLDQEYQALYIAEQKVADLSLYFAGIAILISCLGLFGLATFTAERRMKEISIRKILGLNEFGIICLLSGGFSKMVLTSIAIALPLSYLLARSWLDGFAYKIELEWWLFIAVGMLAFCLSCLTVGIQTFKAAKVNPAQCLKNE